MTGLNGRLSAVGAVVLCLTLAVSGCASRVQKGESISRSVVNPPRSERGNPPFYEVFGKRYYVLDSSSGYDERGVASWYGKQFHRRSTSSGETYDMYAMTAAHKTLPLPTWVEVTNLANGKHVIVKVNDRGPFVKGRLIDLSYAAAKALDMLRAGTAKVEVRSLGAPRDVSPPTTVAARSNDLREPVGTAAVFPAAAQVAGHLTAESGLASGHAGSAAGNDAGKVLFIQVGAFADRSNADKLAARLRADGYTKVFVLDGRDDSLHRVRLGPYADVGEYDQVNEALRRLGFTNTDLVVGD